MLLFIYLLFKKYFAQFNRSALKPDIEKTRANVTWAVKTMNSKKMLVITFLYFLIYLDWFKKKGKSIVENRNG